MKSEQIQFTYKNNVFFMLWEILTDESDCDKVMEYIKERLYKGNIDRDELRKVKCGWHYAVYVE